MLTFLRVDLCAMQKKENIWQNFIGCIRHTNGKIFIRPALAGLEVPWAGGSVDEWSGVF